MTPRSKGWGLILIPFSLPVFAAQQLDLHTLDQVTAAGVNGQLNWIQREGETLVANGSSASVNLTSITSLSGTSQANSASLNIINAAASDTAQLLNIAVAEDEVSQIEQHNNLTQDARFVGRLGRSLSGGPTIFYRYGNGFRNSFSESFTEGRVQINTNQISNYQQEGYTAIVPKWDPSKSFTLSLGSWDVKSINIGKIGFDGIVTVAGVKGGLAASTGPIIIYSPGLDFGSIRVSNDDLILQPGSFTLPAVDFGTATFEACLVKCLTGTTDLGKVGGGTISPFQEKTIPGANPFKDWDLNIGSGIALIGEGDVTISRKASTIDVSLSLDMNKVLGPVTDLFTNAVSSGPIAAGFDKVFGTKISKGFPSLKFPKITVGTQLTIIDAIDETYTFNPNDGGLCLTFGAADCVLKRSITTSLSTEENGTLTETRNRTETTQAESWAFEETLVFVPGNMEEVQADIIVTTDSKLTHIKNNSTLLTDQAQRNLTTINAVNSANAVIGNASNLTTQRLQYIRINTQQTNRFVQYR